MLMTFFLINIKPQNYSTLFTEPEESNNCSMLLLS